MPKKDVALILAGMGKPKGPSIAPPVGEDASAEPMGDLNTAAQDILDAIKAEDAQGLAGALGAFFDMKDTDSGSEG